MRYTFCRGSEACAIAKTIHSESWPTSCVPPNVAFLHVLASAEVLVSIQMRERKGHPKLLTYGTSSRRWRRALWATGSSCSPRFSLWVAHSSSAKLLLPAHFQERHRAGSQQCQVMAGGFGKGNYLPLLLRSSHSNLDYYFDKLHY